MSARKYEKILEDEYLSMIVLNYTFHREHGFDLETFHGSFMAYLITYSQRTGYYPTTCPKIYEDDFDQYFSIVSDNLFIHIHPEDTLKQKYAKIQDILREIIIWECNHKIIKQYFKGG